jgi:hypothetical protein
MVGSVALVLPPNVLNGGLILSALLMTMMGVINYKTCAVIVKYQKINETDFSDII